MKQTCKSMGIGWRRKENIRRIDKLLTILHRWEDEKGLPSSLWTDVAPHQLREMEEEGKVSGVEQVYVLELAGSGKYYVGRTSVGFPNRCFQHGHNDPKYNNMYEHLKFKDTQYKVGIVYEIIDLINPINKKFSCTHWMEWWLQRQMSELRFQLPYGVESSPITKENFHGEEVPPICPECKQICTTIRDKYNENVFDDFLD